MREMFIILTIGFSFKILGDETNPKVAIIFNGGYKELRSRDGKAGEAILMAHRNNTKDFYEKKGYKVIMLEEDGDFHPNKEGIIKAFASLKNVSEVNFSILNHGTFASEKEFEKYPEYKSILRPSDFPNFIKASSSISDNKDTKGIFVLPSPEKTQDGFDPKYDIQGEEIKDVILNFKEQNPKALITIDSLSCHSGWLGTILGEVPKVQVYSSVINDLPAESLDIGGKSVDPHTPSSNVRDYNTFFYQGLRNDLTYLAAHNYARDKMLEMTKDSPSFSFIPRGPIEQYIQKWCSSKKNLKDPSLCFKKIEPVLTSSQIPLLHIAETFLKENSTKIENNFHNFLEKKGCFDEKKKSDFTLKIDKINSFKKEYYSKFLAFFNDKVDHITYEEWKSNVEKWQELRNKQAETNAKNYNEEFKREPSRDLNLSSFKIAKENVKQGLIGIKKTCMEDSPQEVVRFKNIYNYNIFYFWNEKEYKTIKCDYIHDIYFKEALADFYIQPNTNENIHNCSNFVDDLGTKSKNGNYQIYLDNFEKCPITIGQYISNLDQDLYICDKVKKRLDLYKRDNECFAKFKSSADLDEIDRLLEILNLGQRRP